ncbi:MAG: response regulator transcription factor [Dehalococcoidia bacterium]|nr:response regulator transcription factor [Dehalococcoidia bacterium]
MKAIIIEDDEEVIEAISLCFELRQPDISVICARRGLEGVHLVEKESPDIVILDIGLPDIDGFEVCRLIRLFSSVPIIMLTARSKGFDEVKGLEMGADDYVTKPFRHAELMARVRATLRRSTMPKHEEVDKQLTIGNLTINMATHEVSINREEVKLTPTEYRLLHLLAKNQGQAVTNRVIMEKIWGSEYKDADDYLKVYIKRLRTKLGDNPLEPRLILPERASGYKLTNWADDLRNPKDFQSIPGTVVDPGLPAESSSFDQALAESLGLESTILPGPVSWERSEVSDARDILLEDALPSTDIGA